LCAVMSSNDSMGTVFKCLSKGAVDFLLKPIRENELKNLWQHVWRRCHSYTNFALLQSSGSGSENGVQFQKSVKSKSSDDSDNSTGSNDDENASVGLNTRDGSDNGSGTQSSWTKCAAGVDSLQPMSHSYRLADPPDSTCAQVIIPTTETFCKDQVPTSANSENQGKKELPEITIESGFLLVLVTRSATKAGRDLQSSGRVFVDNLFGSLCKNKIAKIQIDKPHACGCPGWAIEIA
ncbi:hypothetical protein B296_00009370, partial [Ensete ventricosum]